jgi:flap endonuclease-1
MGIKDLSKVIGDNSPHSVQQNEMKSYFGRKVAIDASMSIYQFLIAVRQDGAQLMSEAGETTRYRSAFPTFDKGGGEDACWGCD